ncbi:MAG: hypothetical protein KBA26_12055 [Candidatus Delongbacteria bacterium]|nr:hypothetical protein [Candidatus Delongbacteria bacterium]
MGKIARLKTIDDLIEWGKSIMSDDDVDIAEAINVYIEFDQWADESLENEQRIETEVKDVAEKMVKDIQEECHDYYLDGRNAMRTIIKEFKAKNRPVRWYWKIFER